MIFLIIKDVYESYREATRHASYHDSYHNKWARSLIRFKAVDDSIFLSESKCYSIFLHPKWLAIPCAQFGVIQAN